MLVELDVFSGRPNPRWELDERHSRALWQLQSRLTMSSQAQAEPPGLGYRGFRYSDAAGRAHAYHGLVVTTRGALADPDFTIEQYLLEQLPAEFAALRQRISTELVPTK